MTYKCRENTNQQFKYYIRLCKRCNKYYKTLSRRSKIYAKCNNQSLNFHSWATKVKK